MSAKPHKKTFHGMLGKTVVTEDESKVRILDIVHSHKHMNKAVVNGDKFINYLELFCQTLENRRPSKEELNEFNKIASKDQKRSGPASRAVKGNN